MLSGTILKDISHKTKPWLGARAGLTNVENSNKTITNKSIKEYAKTLKIQNYDVNEFCKKYMKDLLSIDICG